ncbi:hypothetical protein LFL96_15680 [Paraburkholderia sp. D15]|uniref:hypothetical protein n=1 Tax=Paraburkholderia sp. D15 TaxID=2880218 RepID=UPI00247ADA8F|nr:hypothetical protein [Paraburkholderia sp. D15]WGS49191.1 hypothetical protein LFL96_15680 [Paraburkholderia sp. D15]WKF57100.1 hypothetical protein HUO10_001578 [Paraburkholderia busanensis]
MKRLALALGITGAACAPPAFAQSNPALQNSVFAQPATTTTYPSAAIAQNFQYINHPPPPAPASAVKPGGASRGGHHRRQTSTDADAGGSTATQ